MGKSNKYIVLVAEGCPACSQLRGKFTGNKNYKLMDVTKSAKALELARKFNITGVPTFLYADEEQGKICVLNDDLTVKKCVKNTKENEK